MRGRKSIVSPSGGCGGAADPRRDHPGLGVLECSRLAQRPPTGGECRLTSQHSFTVEQPSESPGYPKHPSCLDRNAVLARRFALLPPDTWSPSVNCRAGGTTTAPVCFIVRGSRISDGPRCERLCQVSHEPGGLRHPHPSPPFGRHNRMSSALWTPPTVAVAEAPLAGPSVAVWERTDVGCRRSRLASPSVDCVVTQTAAVVPEIQSASVM